MPGQSRDGTHIIDISKDGKGDESEGTRRHTKVSRDSCATHPISCVNTIESQTTPAPILEKDPEILVDTPIP